MSERAPGRRGRLILSLGLVVAGALAVIAGLVLHGREHAQDRAATPSRSASPSPEIGTVATPHLARPEPGAPARIRIPALHVDAPVLPVHAPGSTLVPPRDPMKLGWWADGAEPGSRHGAVLVAGHTVHNGDGALDPLGTLRAGSSVVVRTANGERLRYRARSVRTYSKGSIADQAQRLFAQHGPERLVLVTCTDWDGTRYLSNTVVVAVPA